MGNIRFLQVAYMDEVASDASSGSLIGDVALFVTVGFLIIIVLSLILRAISKTKDSVSNVVENIQNKTKKTSTINGFVRCPFCGKDITHLDSIPIIETSDSSHTFRTYCCEDCYKQQSKSYPILDNFTLVIGIILFFAPIVKAFHGAYVNNDSFFFYILALFFGSMVGVVFSGLWVIFMDAIKGKKRITREQAWKCNSMLSD